jgi:hypothetical protein
MATFSGYTGTHCVGYLSIGTPDGELCYTAGMFAGHYNGKIYEKYVSSVFSDASETSPGAINGYWRSPFKNLGGLDTTVDPLYFTAVEDQMPLAQ